MTQVTVQIFLSDLPVLASGTLAPGAPGVVVRGLPQRQAIGDQKAFLEQLELLHLQFSVGHPI